MAFLYEDSLGVGALFGGGKATVVSSDYRGLFAPYMEEGLRRD